jgi:heme-degrading monooxygenase HmoA
MFIHSALFEIQPKEVPQYRKDSLIWASYARKAKGFIAYYTMKRLDFKNQYASVYEWKTKANHDRFMNKYHDWLVGKSKAKVKILGYFNLKKVDRIKT